MNWDAKAAGWRTGLLAAAVVALAACGPSGHGRVANADAEEADALETSYAAPPEVLRVQPGHGRGPILSGTAEPGAEIRLESPEGDNVATRARRDGRWSLRAPAVTRPRMFALSADQQGRVVHAEGALILIPDASPAALLARAGAGALVIDPPSPRPSIDAVDYDPNGFTAISGVAPPGSAVRLLIDGAAVGMSHADARGRFAVLAAGRRSSFGPHVAVVQAPNGEATRGFELTPPGPLNTPYKAFPATDGWRVEWALPGGGVQTTLVLKQPE